MVPLPKIVGLLSYYWPFRRKKQTREPENENPQTVTIKTIAKIVKIRY